MYLYALPGPDEEAKIYIRILAGVTTGVASVSIAQPTEVVKIRMQSAGVGNRPTYPSVMKAYSEIGKYEGLRGLWRGNYVNWLDTQAHTLIL